MLTSPGIRAAAQQLEGDGSSEYFGLLNQLLTDKRSDAVVPQARQVAATELVELQALVSALPSPGVNEGVLTARFALLQQLLDDPRTNAAQLPEGSLQGLLRALLENVMFHELALGPPALTMSTVADLMPIVAEHGAVHVQRMLRPRIQSPECKKASADGCRPSLLTWPAMEARGALAIALALVLFVQHSVSTLTFVAPLSCRRPSGLPAASLL